ncbi:MAG: anthranilate phosphoribosyltransferase [Candidatus Omnitrophota bacterium]
MIRDAIIALVKGESLSFEEMRQVFRDIFDHKTEASQVAAFLTALKMKGENEEEIFAAATVIRERARPLKVRSSFVGIELQDELVVDTCGTGGSGVSKFNISTAVAFVLAASGAKIAKHGNRAMSSHCGSADVLEAMGLAIDVEPLLMEKAIKQIGIGFLYAPLYHPALKEVAALRREIGIRTIFNLLGPLCNPAGATHQLLGVYSKELVPVMANVLKKLGTQKALVVYGKDFKDEISLSGETVVAFLHHKKIEKFKIFPADFGLRKICVEDIKVKNAEESARLVRAVLNGKKSPARDVVLAGASAGLYLLNKVKTFKEGVIAAAEIIDSGKANEKFIELKRFIDTHKKAA